MSPHFFQSMVTLGSIGLFAWFRSDVDAISDAITRTDRRSEKTQGFRVHWNRPLSMSCVSKDKEVVQSVSQSVRPVKRPMKQSIASLDILITLTLYKLARLLSGAELYSRDRIYFRMQPRYMVCKNALFRRTFEHCECIWNFQLIEFHSQKVPLNWGFTIMIILLLQHNSELWYKLQSLSCLPRLHRSVHSLASYRVNDRAICDGGISYQAEFYLLIGKSSLPHTVATNSVPYHQYELLLDNQTTEGKRWYRQRKVISHDFSQIFQTWSRERLVTEKTQWVQSAF